MTREHRGALALLLALLWYSFGAEPVARRLEESRAGQMRTAGATEAVELILGLSEQNPRALPQGADRGRCYGLLVQALALEQVQVRWSEGALALLSPAQLKVIADNIERPPMSRSRAWPRTPSELVFIAQTLSARDGSAFGEPPAQPEADPMPGTPPLDRLRGLAELVRRNEPALTPEQSRALQLAALEGIRAHEQGWAVSQQLIDALGPAAQEINRPPGAPRADEGRARLALGLLRP